MNLWSRFTSFLFGFFMDTEIIFPDTENIAASYPSSLKGHGYFDVVYLSFQNTSTQTCKNWLVAALFSVFVKIIILSLKRKWAHCISISFRIPSRGRRGVWYQTLVLCFRTKVNAYYVCFNTEYRWLKGCGKQIPLNVFFLWHASF